MTQHDDRVSLAQMLEFAEEAVDLAQGRVREDLDSDRQFCLSILHLIQTVGEAARRVSELCRERHPQIGWLDIVGMRSRIVHAYDIIDLNLVWDTVQDDLPKLIGQLREILGRPD